MWAAGIGLEKQYLGKFSCLNLDTSPGFRSREDEDEDCEAGAGGRDEGKD